MIRVLVATSMLVACGGGQPAPAKPPPATHTTEVTSPPPPTAPAMPTAAECDQLLDHMIDLELARAANGTPAERMPDPKQKAAIREQTGAQFRVECMKMPRRRLACAMAATTIETVAACDDQASSSSSTSNSSVAFGGITPPAPRAP